MDGERIVAADASNLVFDGAARVNAFVVAGVLAPGRFVDADGVVDIHEARRILVPRAAAVPRLAERADTSGRVWTWRRAPVDPERHVRLVPTRALDDVCADLMVTPLDRAYPLWEILLLSSVAPGRAGIVVRVHHAIADGSAAAAILTAIADPPSSPPPPSKSAPLVEPLRGVRGVMASAAQWMRISRTPRLAETSLLGDATGRRSVRFASVDLARFRAGGAAAGGTLNDAVLAAIAGAVTASLRALGDDVPNAVGMSVPVAVRRRRDEGNALSGAVVPVPLCVADMVRRIQAIHAATADAVQSARLAGAGSPTRSRGMMRWFMRYADRQRRVAVVMSTLRGPQERLRFGESELVEAYPVGTLGGNVRLSVVAVSYAGRLGWGVHSADPLPADVIGEALLAEAGRVVALADRGPRQA